LLEYCECLGRIGCPPFLSVMNPCDFNRVACSGVFPTEQHYARGWASRKSGRHCRGYRNEPHPHPSRKYR